MPNIKLPKEFAEQWLAALRSGEYIQGDGYLAQSQRDEEAKVIPNAPFCYCCLGVGAKICKIEENLLEQREYTSDVWEDVPEPIRGETFVSHILSSLNDGLAKDGYEKAISDGFIFRKEVIHHLIPNEVDKYYRVRFSFEQIADFIQDNIEYTDV